jgi:hypothetical protein
LTVGGQVSAVGIHSLVDQRCQPERGSRDDLSVGKAFAFFSHIAIVSAFCLVVRVLMMTSLAMGREVLLAESEEQLHPEAAPHRDGKHPIE